MLRFADPVMNFATRLLVVDDDPGIRGLTAALRQHGYLADGAELSGQALRLGFS